MTTATTGLRLVHQDSQPPRDHEAEREMLGICILWPELLDTSDLGVADFYIESHRIILHTLLAMRADGESIGTVELTARLDRDGRLRRVGGDMAIVELTEGVSEPRFDDRLAHLREMRQRREGYALTQRAQLAWERGDLESARANLLASVELLGKPLRSPTALAAAWRPLAEWGVMENIPPARQWLLQRPDEETNGTTNPVGVLPLGKTGLLVSPGGVGKTCALIQLAVAVATGRSWLDFFHVSTPGRVLVALGEEDPDEVSRRFFQAARAMRLTPEQLRLAQTNIVALPLAGAGVALVESCAGTTTETGVLRELRQRLSEVEWRLIILDPLSRFAGGDTEKDNAAATRFIQVAESLSATPGNPTVLIAHHTNKLSRTDESSASAAHARGASGLIDAVRWVANLENVGADRARLTITKSNYARCGSPVQLVRDFDHGGFLRVATGEEQRRREEAQINAARRRESERALGLESRIVEALASHPGLSANRIRQALAGAGVGVRDESLRQTVAQMLERGRIRRSGKCGYEIAPVSGRATPDGGPHPASSRLIPDDLCKCHPVHPTPLGGDERKTSEEEQTTLPRLNERSEDEVRQDAGARFCPELPAGGKL